MKKCVANIVLLLFVLGAHLSQAQTSECSCATDSMQSFSLEKQEYRFSFTQLSQSFCFDHIVYTTFPRITVHVVNDSPDTLINLYRERDAHIMWMRSGELMDTIYPGQAMTLRGLVPGGKMIGTVNTCSIYLKYQIGDSIYHNKIAVCGSMFPLDFQTNSWDISYYPNGKVMRKEYVGPDRNKHQPYLTEYYDTGCKSKEISEYNYASLGRTEIKYRRDICDCMESKINRNEEIYFKKCGIADSVVSQNMPNIRMGVFDTLLNLIHGREIIGDYTFQKVNNSYLDEFTFKRFKNLGEVQHGDSIFVMTFNRTEKGLREGIWIECDLTTNDFVRDLQQYEKDAFGKTKMVYKEFVYRFPWSVYEAGQLIETRYYSSIGELSKLVAYQGADTLVKDYTYKIQLDSSAVDMYSPYFINYVRHDTLDYFSNRFQFTILVYENNELRQRSTPLYKIESYSYGAPSYSNGFRDVALPFTIERGEFRDLELYNGVIEYYDLPHDTSKPDRTLVKRNGS